MAAIPNPYKPQRPSAAFVIGQVCVWIVFLAWFLSQGPSYSSVFARDDEQLKEAVLSIPRILIGLGVAFSFSGILSAFRR